MILDCLLGILAGSLLWLDRVYVFQFMLSRPLVMGPLIGLVMGDVKTGIIIGASLELLWLNAPPVGTYLPNDESFCTAVAVPVAILAGSTMDHTAASGLSILLSLPAALIGRSLDMRLRSMNEGLIDTGAQVLEKDISRALRTAVARAFLMAFMALSLCVMLLGSFVHLIRGFIPSVLTGPLKFVPFVCVVVGIAVLLSKDLPSKKHAGAFLLGVTLVLLITLTL